MTFVYEMLIKSTKVKCDIVSNLHQLYLFDRLSQALSY